jgi:hypothetical protein
MVTKALLWRKQHQLHLLDATLEACMLLWQLQHARDNQKLARRCSKDSRA